MTDDQRAAWIRRVLVLVLLGGAALAAIFLDPPQGWSFAREPKVERTVKKIDEKNITEFVSQSDKIAVLHAMVDGNPNSEKLAEIIENLKKEETFKDQVDYGEVDMKKDFELVVGTDSEPIDFEEFAGQLDFYGDGRKLGSLIGETDPLKVEAEIRRYLAGLFQRVGTDWMPDVPGMQRVGGSSPVIDVKPVAR